MVLISDIARVADVIDATLSALSTKHWHIEWFVRSITDYAILVTDRTP